MFLLTCIIEYFQLLTPNPEMGKGVGVVFAIVVVAAFLVGTFLVIVGCVLELGRAPFSDYLEEWLLHMKVAIYIIIGFFGILSAYTYIVGNFL